jgi:ligand-binding sensor domain-containing protein
MKLRACFGTLALALVLSNCGPGDTPATVEATPVPIPTPEPTRTAADWVLSEGRWENYDTSDGLPHNTIRALAFDSGGQLWVGTDGAGGLFDGGSWQTIVPRPLPLMDIAFDNQGQVWLADGLGVEVYAGGELTSFAERGLSSVQSEAIMVDSQGRVWVAFSSGTDADGGGGGGVDVLEEETWRHYGIEDGLFGSTVFGLAEDQSGNIWAAGEQGLAWFDGATWHAMLLPDQPPSQALNCVAAGPDGRIWFGAMQIGLWIWDGVEWAQYTSSDGLAGDTVWDVAFDDTGRAWIGTGDGLSVFDGETWINLTTDDGLTNNSIRTILTGRDGVWIGTWRGLSHLAFD